MERWSSLTRRSLTAGIFLVLAAGAGSASTDPNGTTVLADLMEKYRRPTEIPFPASNPYSDAKAELGRVLFFDPRLSGPGTHSCASCHNPGLGWRDGLTFGVGHDAQGLPRATPTIVDLAWGASMMWDGRKDGLEDQATSPIETVTEMNLSLPDMEARLAALPAYRHMFQAAFEETNVTAPKVAQALATYERTLVSNEAPFDRWIRGDAKAIGEDAKRGFGLFNGRANCGSCHSGWRFTDDGFHDVGLPGSDLGRGAIIPGEPTLERAFKTPTLRNVDTRAPYMHDGSLRTLADVMAHYDTGFIERPSLAPEMHHLDLTPNEIRDVIAFLHTLTSRDDPVVIPTLPVLEQAP